MENNKSSNGSIIQETHTDIVAGGERGIFFSSTDNRTALLQQCFSLSGFALYTAQLNVLRDSTTSATSIRLMPFFALDFIEPEKT